MSIFRSPARSRTACGGAPAVRDPGGWLQRTRLVGLPRGRAGAHRAAPSGTRTDRCTSGRSSGGRGRRWRGERRGAVGTAPGRPQWPPPERRAERLRPRGVRVRVGRHGGRPRPRPRTVGPPRCRHRRLGGELGHLVWFAAAAPRPGQLRKTFLLRHGGVSPIVAWWWRLHWLSQHSAPAAHAPVSQVGVCDSPAYFEAFIDESVCGGLAGPRAGTPPPPCASFLNLVDGSGSGYAVATAEELRLVLDVAAEGAVLLDPVGALAVCDRIGRWLLIILESAPSSSGVLGQGALRVLRPRARSPRAVPRQGRALLAHGRRARGLRQGGSNPAASPAAGGPPRRRAKE